jgi:hypothetical protein
MDSHDKNSNNQEKFIIKQNENQKFQDMELE